MADFHQRSKSFLRDLSKAAAWMTKRNAGETHWWRWIVLTDRNRDPRSRPVFEDATAQHIFEDLARRDLLREVPQLHEEGAPPAYLMRYDLDGWDRAVSDGRPLVGLLLKLRRNWPSLVLVFLLGSILTVVENRMGGAIDLMLDWVLRQMSS